MCHFVFSYFEFSNETTYKYEVRQSIFLIRLYNRSISINRGIFKKQIDSKQNKTRYQLIET